MSAEQVEPNLAMPRMRQPVNRRGTSPLEGVFDRRRARPKSWSSALSALSASSRTNVGAGERATGGAGACDPESRSSVSAGSRPGKLPPAPLLLCAGRRPPRDYGVWRCSSRGQGLTAAGVDCGRRQPRSLRRARRPTSPCRSRERVARERVPSEGGADRGDLRGVPQLRVAW
jgi:hypothetical protein